MAQVCFDEAYIQKDGCTTQVHVAFIDYQLVAPSTLSELLHTCWNRKQLGVLRV